MRSLHAVVSRSQTQALYIDLIEYDIEVQLTFHRKMLSQFQN